MLITAVIGFKNHIIARGMISRECREGSIFVKWAKFHGAEDQHK